MFIRNIDPLAPLPIDPSGGDGRAVPGVVRAGRPRSQEAFIHTKNREHGLLHAGESGKTPYASLEYHSPLEGESQTRAKPAVEPVGGERRAP